MAGAVTHHEPAKTKNPGSDNNTPEISQSSSNGKGGRPPSPRLVEQDDTPDYAQTTDRIEENYPFFGTLLKYEDGRYRLKETIKKSEAQDFEWVKRRYKGGDYQLRINTDEGLKKIPFTVPNVETVDEKQSGSQKVIDEEFIADLRKKLKQEIRSDFESDISRMERRVGSLNDELEEKSRKLRDRTIELAETDRKAAQTTRQSTEELERKIDNLKEEKKDLEFENFKLEQKLEYSDAEKGFDLAGMIKEAANDPQTVKMLAPLINKLFGGDQPGSPQPQPALNGAPSANGQPRTNGNGQSRKNGQQAKSSGASNASEPKQDENNEQDMAQMIQQFQKGVVQTVASSMMNDEPAAEQLKQLVLGGVRDLKNAGIEPEPGMWLNIAERLIKFCLENPTGTKNTAEGLNPILEQVDGAKPKMWIKVAKNLISFCLEKSITAQTAAEKIRPILAQMDGAEQKLKYMPASAAAQYLIGNYSVEVTDAQKKFLIGILQVFKSELDHPQQSAE